MFFCFIKIRFFKNHLKLFLIYFVKLINKMFVFNLSEYFHFSFKSFGLLTVLKSAPKNRGKNVFFCEYQFYHFKIMEN